MKQGYKIFSYVFIFAFVLLGFIIAPKTSAESNQISFNYQTENTDVRYVQLGKTERILNHDMEEIGKAYEKAILPVQQVRDGLYEILADFQVNGVDDEILLLESPYYETISEIIPASCDEVRNMNLIEKPLTFDEGVRLKNVFGGETSTVSFDTGKTFSSYYQAGDMNIIELKEQFYFVEPLKSEKVISEEVQLDLDTGKGSRKGKIEAPAANLTENDAVGGTDTSESIATEATKTQSGSIPIFKTSDNYFKVTLETVPVYDNSGGALRVVGYLTKGQVYPRVSDYGDWHRIKYGDKYGYVWKAATTPASGNDIHNENHGQKNTDQTFRGIEDLAVYDNTSGSLVPFGRINKGEKYPILGTMGEWIRVDFSGRIGYVYAPSTVLEFIASDKYFKVLEEAVPVYDNSGGSLRAVGYLTKDQVYPKVNDYGDWHQIYFGGKYGYVWKAATTPASGRDILNENHDQKNTGRTFRGIEDLAVYDNTSGALVPFGRINKGEKYPILGTMGEWIRIDFLGRIGYAYAPSAVLEFMESDKYFKVLEEAVAVYDNSGGSLRTVGYLTKDQVYPRVSDYGDWHQIKFGDRYGYVWEAATTPALGSSIRNENMSEGNTGRSFQANENLMVYDNTSGVLVPFGRINRGEKYPLMGKMGDWIRVDFSGRIGFVYAPAVTIEFLSSDKYFKVLEDEVPVYDVRDSSWSIVGYLKRGQEYPRVIDTGNWHKIKFGNQFGYVRKATTTVTSGDDIRNENEGIENSKQTVKMMQDVEVFDNSSGTLVPFARIKTGEIYPIISEEREWFKIDFSGRIGYVYKSFTQKDPILEYIQSDFNITLDQFLSIQMRVSPQTDLYRSMPAYVSKEYVEYLNDEKHLGYYVTATALNVREAPNSDSNTFIYGTLKNGTQVTVIREVNGWYEILYTWRNAKREDTVNYLDPNSNNKYQHLRLDVSAGLSGKEINTILIGKGILEDRGQAFKEASQKYQINEAYLISHALLETGNGTSDLALGIPIKVTNGTVTIVDPTKEKPQYTVYNMYGIGAKDLCPKQCGAQKAYDEGWFTPELAIIGGAQFVDSNYIQNGQNTLYKMRWNPEFAGQNGYASHQYASDIGWAVKQAQIMEEFYKKMNHYYVLFDFPIFM